MASFGTFSGSGIGFGLTMTLKDMFTAPATRIRASMSGLEAASQELTMVMNNNFGRLMTGMSAVAAGFATLIPVHHVYKEAARYEQLTVAMETLTGSAANAKKLLGEINAFASTTPFSLIQTEEAVKQLLAFNIPLKDVMGDMKALGDITAAFGDRNKLDRLILAYGQVKAARTLKGGEERQFREVGLNLVELLENIGVHVDPNKNIADQKIPFEKVAEAIRAATSEGGRFANLMDKLSMTTSGLWSNIGDMVERVARAFGETLLPPMKAAYKFLLPVLGAIESFVSTISGKVLAAVITLATVLTGLTIMTIGLIMIFTALAPAIGPAVLLLKEFLVIVSGVLPSVLKLGFGIFALYKAFNTNNGAIWALGTALALVLGPLYAVGSLIFVIVRAWKEFQAVLANPAELRLTGLLGMLQRIGAIMYAIYYAWKYATLDNFYLPVELVDMLQTMGIYEFTIALITWTNRFRAFFMGMAKAIKDFYKKFKEFVHDVRYWFSMDPDGGGWISWLGRATSYTRAWYEAGKQLAEKILPGIILLLAILAGWAFILMVANPFVFWVLVLFGVMAILQKISGMGAWEIISKEALGFLYILTLVRDGLTDILGGLNLLVYSLISGLGHLLGIQFLKDLGAEGVANGHYWINKYDVEDDWKDLDKIKLRMNDKFDNARKYQDQANKLAPEHDRRTGYIQELSNRKYKDGTDPSIIKADQIRLKFNRDRVAELTEQIQEMNRLRDTHEANYDFARSGQAKNNPNVVHIDFNVDGTSFYKAIVDVTNNKGGVEN